MAAGSVSSPSPPSEADRRRGPPWLESFPSVSSRKGLASFPAPCSPAIISDMVWWPTSPRSGAVPMRRSGQAPSSTRVRTTPGAPRWSCSRRSGRYANWGSSRSIPSTCCWAYWKPGAVEAGHGAGRLPRTDSFPAPQGSAQIIGMNGKPAHRPASSPGPCIRMSAVSSRFFGRRKG